MTRNPLQHLRLQRAAAWLALFAVALIIIAPLISVSLQKDPMSAMPGMHHEMSMPMEHHSGAPVMMPVDHAEACGYCVLLAHVPGMLMVLTLLVSVLQRYTRRRIACAVVQLWHFFPWLYPQTRAPPGRPAFSFT
ncbi:DUF2946 domain-containing protein [Yokenella regensburgei]|uniref:DUF2946 domain-containing protein n=1 Tax=Yokenella regensburgei TaxID=158877 RepID=UPI0035B39D1A